jgi:hypothetical protein
LSFEGPSSAERVALRDTFDIWNEGHSAKYDADIGGIDREVDSACADYVLAPDVLVGAIVQIDDTDIDDPSLNGEIERQRLDGRAACRH